jgi:hypothetical protein
MTTILQLDNESLGEWADKLNEIKTFVTKHIETLDNQNRLMCLISEYENLARQRSRIIMVNRILKD